MYSLRVLLLLLFLVSFSSQVLRHRRSQSHKTYHSIPSSINCTAHSYDSCPLEEGCQREMARRNGEEYKRHCVFLDKAAPKIH